MLAGPGASVGQPCSGWWQWSFEQLGLASAAVGSHDQATRDLRGGFSIVIVS